MIFGVTPGPPNVHLVTSPHYHTAVSVFGGASLMMGHRLVYMDGWDAERALALVEQHKVTNTHMVPTHFGRLLALPEETRRRYDVSSMRWILHAAAPCPLGVKRAMLDWWGPRVYEYYAATEGGGTLATPEDWLAKPGTVGRPWPISEVMIADEDGEKCPPGVPGIVYMRSDLTDFVYKGDPAKTQAARMNGFFTVGDIGYLDEDGYLFLCDRKADMIISGGANIYPAEIEGEVIMYPQVADVAVTAPGRGVGGVRRRGGAARGRGGAGPGAIGEHPGLAGRAAGPDEVAQADRLHRADAQGPERQVAQAPPQGSPLAGSRHGHLTGRQAGPRAGGPRAAAWPVAGPGSPLPA